jgi:hypothetical protein
MLCQIGFRGTVLCLHFGERILDNLFDKYRETVDEEMAKENKQVTLGGRRKMKKRERERE